MREFVDEQTREGGFGTPTEYVRSLIRADRTRTVQHQFAPLLLKWLTDGSLSPAEQASLPPGLLDRAQRNLENGSANRRASGQWSTPTSPERGFS